MKKSVISIFSGLAGAVVGMATGAGIVAKMESKEENRLQKFSDKHLELFLLMNQWVKVKQDGKNLSTYLLEKGYKKIAIYGMSYAGETLIKELKNGEVEIVYGIDRNADTIFSDIPVFPMNASLQNVDTVVVTAVTFFDEIEEQLSNILNCPIISLEEMLYEV